MKIKLLGKDYAIVSFSGNAKVSIKTDDEQPNNEYNVKWLRRRTIKDEYDHIGSMDLRIGRWGMHNYEDIEQWKIEFWNNEKMVCMYDNNLANKDVILVAKTNALKIGKGVDFESIKKYCTNKVNEFNCNLKVYFPESCSFDFSSLNFKPLRMNDEIKEMHYGLEKEF
jgi:hypothetical protein